MNKRILMYSHDAYGLGNIRRMLEIADHLVQSDPDVSILLVSGSPMAHAFRMPARVDYIKLPSVGRTQAGAPCVRSLGLGYEQVIRLRAGVIAAAALDFLPDLVLVDKQPFGIADELAPALALLRERAHPPKVVLLLRDILDAPEATRLQWEKRRNHETIHDYYDRVLVVGTEQVFDAAAEYGFPEATARKVRYCGYIERPQPAKPAQQVRRELGLGAEPLVLVTAGGGGDGLHLMRTYLAGLAGRGDSGFATLLVVGPEMSPAHQAELGALAARCAGVVVREFTDDMMSCMGAADVVVAMGGYNTVCELLTLKKRMVIVPRVEPVQEQWLRAQRMQQMGLLRVVHPDALCPEGLVGVVREELARPPGGSDALQAFALDGLPRIAASIAELLAAPAANPPAASAPDAPAILAPATPLAVRPAAPAAATPARPIPAPAPAPAALWPAAEARPWRLAPGGLDGLGGVAANQAWRGLDGAVPSFTAGPAC